MLRRGAVAVKVQRPGVLETVAADAALARAAAGWLEGLRGPGGGRLLRPALVRSVDEFFSRLYEEFDFVNERANLDAFAETMARGLARASGWAAACCCRARCQSTAGGAC